MAQDLSPVCWMRGERCSSFPKGKAEALKGQKNERGFGCLLNPACSSAHLTYFP